MSTPFPSLPPCVFRTVHPTSFLFLLFRDFFYFQFSLVGLLRYMNCGYIPVCPQCFGICSVEANLAIAAVAICEQEET